MASEAKQDSTFNAAKQLYAEQFGDAIVTNTYLKIALLVMALVAGGLIYTNIKSVAEAYRKNHTIENYLQDSSGPDIDIEVQKVSIEDLRSAPYKATVDFYEIAYSPLDHVETKRTLYTAHFVFLFRDSVPNDLIQVNPLDLAVTYFREDEAFK